MIPSGPGTSLTTAEGMLWTRVPDVGLLRAYEAAVPDGVLHAIVTQEPQGWHLSVSFAAHDGRPLRLPSWDELKDARYRFVPDRAHMAALLPPRAEWVDIHPTCLHLWEIPAEVAERPTERDGLVVQVCSVCHRERTLQDAYDYNPIQALTHKPFGWYSGEDGEICPQCMTDLMGRNGR